MRGRTLPRFDCVVCGRSAYRPALADPKMKARLADFGGTPFVVSPADFGKLIAEETESGARW